MTCKTLALIGQQFGVSSCIAFSGMKDSISYWLFRCVCGKEFIGSGRDAVANKKLSKSFSCGCLSHQTPAHLNALKMIGKKFSHLLCLAFVGTRNDRGYYLFRCDCGKEVV